MKQGKVFLRECKRYFFMVIGCICYALSLCIFLIPNNIVGGGVSGAASLINIMTGLPAGVFIVVINFPILVFGFKLMGWKFILRCLSSSYAPLPDSNNYDSYVCELNTWLDETFKDDMFKIANKTVMFVGKVN